MNKNPKRRSRQAKAHRREFLAAGASAAAIPVLGAPLGQTAKPDSDPQTSAGTEGDVRLRKIIARPDLWFYPGELLADDEMRVTLMGTGWGSVIRPEQAGASIFVELGNGDAFLFDAGPGCMINYNALQVPFSRMDKIFLTHLHTDHTTALPWIYAFGPAGDRFTPLRIWGPSGDKPEMGTASNMAALKPYTQWHRTSFETCIDVGKGYELDITELDYRQNPGVAYDHNGVTITHWPALHVIDGAISYKLQWNGLSMVWSGDTEPNHFMVENAKGVDLLIHETAPAPQRFADASNVPLAQAELIVANSHTPAKALGKIFSLTEPQLGVTCHCPVDPQELQSMITAVGQHWSGHYQIGEDRMVFNISREKITIRRGVLIGRPWTVLVDQPSSTTPTLQAATYRSPKVFDQEIKDY